jgi:CRISPR system Cascade subunit CasE
MTMYLSRLTLNPRDRNARRDLSSPYELHSTLARMFARAPAQAERVLFRLERGENHVLIQSRTRPDFSALPRSYCLQAECRDDYGEKLHAVGPGQRLAFRLLANPTCRETLGEGDAKRKRRKPLLDWQAQEAWLRRKLTDQAGAQLVSGRAVILDTQRNEKRGSRSSEGTQTHVPVLFEGVLAVDDPDRLRAAIENGIGSAKGYGFGLLSIAPA